MSLCREWPVGGALGQLVCAVGAKGPRMRLREEKEATCVCGEKGGSLTFTVGSPGRTRNRSNYRPRSPRDPSLPLLKGSGARGCMQKIARP